MIADSADEDGVTTNRESLSTHSEDEEVVRNMQDSRERDVRPRMPAGKGQGLHYDGPSGPPPPAPPAQDRLADAMAALAQAMTAQTRQQRQATADAAADRRRPPPDLVRVPSYDGKTDVEDFINLFEYICYLYEWNPRTATVKLKTSLQGTAMECARGDDCAAIFTALRAKFGITSAEAKRSLLSMKTGQTDRLRELADRIKKLTQLAYPDLEAEMIGVLSLDQFKRCVSTDLSLFMVSRPPANLEAAVAICGEYLSANPRHKRMQLSAISTGDEKVKPEAMEVNAFGTTPLSPVQKELQDGLKNLQDLFSGFAKDLIKTCASSFEREIRQAAGNTATGSRPENKSEATTAKRSWGPCPKCKGPHQLRFCRKREPVRSEKTTPKSGNASRPQQ